MKAKLISLVFALGFVMISINGTAQQQDLKTLKQQSQVVRLNADLVTKKIDLEKERQNNLKLSEEVKYLDKKSNRTTNKFSTSDPRTTAKDARNTAKILRQTEAANKDLRRSNLKIEKMERDILKLEEKLKNLQYAVEIKEN
ncbi:hypothetical protein [Kaistella sp.]|uniref:hypothetical protein n=1 Tax=Kaistella sp. TaxID=2782235 RepID=UPI0035A13FB4